MKKIFFAIAILVVMVVLASVAYATEGEVKIERGRFRLVTEGSLIKTNDTETIISNQRGSLIAKLTPGTKVPICESRKERDGLWHYATITECKKTISYDKASNSFIVENVEKEEKRERKFNPFFAVILGGLLCMGAANVTRKGWFAAGAISFAIVGLFIASPFPSSPLFSAGLLLGYTGALVASMGVFIAGVIEQQKMYWISSILFYFLFAIEATAYIFNLV
ncbi:MAG: hypothetical protein GXP44_02585 [bacterium]|nr:hypothetical protein [bacterium]